MDEDLYHGATYMTIIILLGISPVFVIAQPQLSSSIGSLELSGEQCPGTLTLTCDAENLGNAESISWFVGGDDRLAEFDYRPDETPLPYMFTTTSDLLNATVEITSVNESNGLFSFLNFTLSAKVTNFISLQGQNISCGTVNTRSLPFVIREFYIAAKNNEDAPLNVSYLANYNGTEGRLVEIVLVWIENLDSNCTNMISYSINIIHENTSMTTNYTSEVCSSNRCSVEIDFSQKVMSDVIVNFYAEDRLISSTIIASTTGNIVSVDECSGEVSIRCSGLNINENCTINYQQDGINIIDTVPPFTLVSFSVKTRQLQVIGRNGSTTFHRSINITDRGSCGSSASTAVIVGVVVPVVVLTLVLVPVIFAIFVIIREKRKTDSTIEQPSRPITEQYDIHQVSIKFDERGMSNAEQNVVQGHKPMGRGSDFILEEKEILIKAALEIELERGRVSEDL